MINNNGFDYIDLCLPSGTLWATCNVGANKPTDSGLYFQWGNTIGYSLDQIGRSKEKKPFDWDDYKFSVDGSDTKFNKYTNIGYNLDLHDDAAHINMGGDWHIPNIDQFRELRDNTTSEWITLDNTSGMKFISKKDLTKYIFIPAAGYITNGKLINNGSEAYIWSSMLDTWSVWYGVYLDLYSKDSSNHIYMNNIGRNCGLSVRGVIG